MDRRLRAAMITVVVAACAFTGVAAYAWSLRAALSVAVGGAIAVSNLWVLARIVASLMPAEGEDIATNAKSAWTVMALLKLTVLFGGVWFLMTKHLVDPIPLVVGFGALPIGIAIGSIVSDRNPKI
jgi:hypothetical protein